MNRFVRAALVFVGAGFALLTVAAQFAPGYRAAPTQPPLSPLPLRAGGATGSFAIERTSADLPGGVRAWITRPKTADDVPGLVFVGGSGSHDRDTMLGKAESLARAGVAVLTYDKRDAGYSFFQRDFRQLARDAVEATVVLAGHRGVDAKRVGILGFSEGGWVVPFAVEQAPERFAFSVFVSAPLVSPLEQAVWIVDHQLRWAPEWIRRIPATALASGRGTIGYLDTDVAPALRTMRTPVYAVWGANDPIVPVAAAERMLASNIAPPVTTRLLANTGHDPGAGGWLRDLAAWIDALPTSAVDEVRGAEPSSRAGVVTPPDNAWFLNPIGHAAVALALAVAAFLRSPKRSSS